MRFLSLLLVVGCPFPEPASLVPTEDTADPSVSSPPPLYTVPVGAELAAQVNPLQPTGTAVVPLLGFGSVHRLEREGQTLLVGLQQQPDNTTVVGASVFEGEALHEVVPIMPAAAVAGPGTVFILGRPDATTGDVPVLRPAAGTCERLTFPDGYAVVGRASATSCAFVDSVDGDTQDDLAVGYVTGDSGGVAVIPTDGSAILTRQFGPVGYSLSGFPVDVVELGGTQNGVVGSQGDPTNANPSIYDPAKVAVEVLASGSIDELFPESTAVVFDSLDRYCPQGPSVSIGSTHIAVGFPAHTETGVPVGGGEVLVAQRSALPSEGPVRLTREQGATVVTSTLDGFGASVLLVNHRGGENVDLLVAAPASNQVFLFADLSEAVLTDTQATAVWSFANQPQGAGLGVSLRSLGDLDGDGREEVAVQVTNHDSAFAASTYVVFSAP